MLQSLRDPKCHKWHLPSICVLANKVWKSPQLTGVGEPDCLANSKLGSSAAFLLFKSLSKREQNKGSDTRWWMCCMAESGCTNSVFLEGDGVLHPRCEDILVRVHGRSLPTHRLTPAHQQSDFLCTVAENITPTDNIHLQQFSSNWASLQLCSRRTMTAGRHKVWTGESEVEVSLSFSLLLF